MQNNKVVLDTNCLLACISSKSENFRVWKDFQVGCFTLCVSNEILEEYQEIIARKANPVVAENVINAIEVKSGRRGMNSGLPEFVEAFHPKRSFVVGTSGVSLEDFLNSEVEEIL